MMYTYVSTYVLSAMCVFVDYIALKADNRGISMCYCALYSSTHHV